MSDRPEWFAAKRYGLGAGLPIAWQGWAVSLAFVALLALAGFIIPHSWIAYVAIVVTLTGLFILIAARTTRGGWRWRWGERD